MPLESNRLILRALEKQDATKMMIWENNPKFWRVSDTDAPFSMHAIQQFVEQQDNFRHTGQVRLIIEKKENKEAIGCVDLFDGNMKHRRAAVGILIADEANHGKGYATESIQLLEHYANDFLDLHQLYAHVEESNEPSVQLFENAGFKHIGTLKDWRRWNKTWVNVLIYQKILD